MDEKKWILVGLGNPGRAYAHHRHNVGIQLIHHLQKAWNFPEFTIKEDYAMSAMDALMLVYPLRYMNLSGPALVPLVTKMPQTKANWLVIHDELDLACGQIRLKKGGSARGHNGVRSLGQTTLGLDFLRLKIGIDRPEKKTDVSPYVLSGFSSPQRPLIEHAFKHALACLPLLLEGQQEVFTQACLKSFV